MLEIFFCNKTGKIKRPERYFEVNLMLQRSQVYIVDCQQRKKTHTNIIQNSIMKGRDMALTLTTNQRSVTQVGGK